MSYDIGVRCSHCMQAIGEDENYTGNVAPMWLEAIGSPNGIKALHQMRCNVAAAHLEKAIADMVKRPEHYLIMNPVNGWGNYEGARDVLVRLLRKCMDNPDAVVYVYD